jgi:release factor glutamine methyltransferase
MSQKSWTVGELLKVTTDYLRSKKIDSSRLNAEVLLAHQLRLDRVQLYLSFEKPLNEKEVSGYRSLIKRRVNREPLQHITGTQEFWSLDFAVGPQALVPRPETEVLVEKILELYREKCLGDRPKILDLGTGSGIIAVAVASEIPGARIWATDISPDALDLAGLNARKHGVEERIHFSLGDMFEAVEEQGLNFGVIASNPPYIPSGLLNSLDPEVKDHDPRLALDGGEDGMFFVTKIIKEAADHLSQGGWLAVEMDPDQTPKAMNLMEQSGRYSSPERIKDYTRRYRVVMAQKR